MKFGDKVAIITGGSRGIGRAMAMDFAREGAKVAVVCKHKSHSDEVVALIGREGGEAISLEADVACETDVAKMVAQTKDKFQRIDILVNCAAVNLPYRTVAQLTLEEWNFVFGVNLTGTFLCCRAVLPEMMGQRSGKIINFSSVGGRQGCAGRAPYCPTKAAVISFTECLAAEVKKFGIDVNTICPGCVDTDMVRELSGGKAPPFAMQPKEISAVVMFLASDEGKSITGTAINAYGLDNPIFRSVSSVKK